MSRKLYIADWHYGHEEIIAFDNRPFSSLTQMNYALVDRWNQAVDQGDIVYVDGDMFWCKEAEALEVLQTLNGQVFLIKGNHDRVSPKMARMMAGVKDYHELKDGDKHIVLSHYPIPCFKNHFYGWYHFYGHVHKSFEYEMMEHDRFLMNALYGKQCLMFSVGAMMPWMDYTPRTADEVVEGYNAFKNFSPC